MNNISKFSLISLVICALSIVYFSFGLKPDLILWSWFGYNFGINISSYVILKVTAFILCIAFYVTFKTQEKK